MNQKMTPAQELAIAIYRNVYSYMDPEWCDLRNNFESESIVDYHWDRPAHKEFLGKAETILRLVDNDLDKALAIIEAL